MNHKTVLLGLFALFSVLAKAENEHACVVYKEHPQVKMLACLAVQKKREPREIRAFHAHHSLGALKVLHDGAKFIVQDNGGSHAVSPFDLDKTLKTMPASKLEAFQKNGYLEVKRAGKDYRLISHVRGDGGGPTTGWAMYVGTQVVGYGGFAVGCFFDPHLIIHAGEIHEGIQMAATGALYLGTIAPTP